MPAFETVVVVMSMPPVDACALLRQAVNTACESTRDRRILPRMQRSQRDSARVVRVAALRCMAAGSLAAAALLAGSTTARAESAGAEAGTAPRVTWRAPASCPDREAVASRLRDTLGTELASFGRNWQVQGQVQRAADGQWRLVLELREPQQPSTAPARQRVLHARRCADLVEAAAVAVALALGDAREVAAESSAAESPASEPPASEPPASEPPVAAPPAPVPAAPRDSTTAPGIALAESDAAPLPRAPQPKSLSASLEALLDTASVSGPALGGSLALGGWLGDFALDAHATWLPAREEEIRAGQTADFGLLAAGARLCARLWGSAQGLGLAGCAGMEVGRFSAESFGLVAAGRVQDTWLAPSLGVDLRGKLLGPLAARSRLELLAPLRRQEYRVDLSEPVHEIPALTVRWSLGFEADWALP
ncbi:MAG: hypothetical protein RL685_7140 [Pseudomonadota bacterium]|jgi:hypothetical protein